MGIKRCENLSPAFICLCLTLLYALQVNPVYFWCLINISWYQDCLNIHISNRIEDNTKVFRILKIFFLLTVIVWLWNAKLNHVNFKYYTSKSKNCLKYIYLLSSLDNCFNKSVVSKLKIWVIKVFHENVWINQDFEYIFYFHISISVKIS